MNATHKKQITELDGAKIYTPIRIAGLIIGLVCLVMPHILPPPAGLSVAGWNVVGVALLMAIWWVTGPIHITATALIPLVAFPVLDIANIKDAASGFAHPLVFLFMGGFFIARALQRWNLHKRIALTIASHVGTRPDMLILGFMVAVAFLSMWVSNTATTVMMLPVAASVIAYIGKGDDLQKDRDGVGTAMMLAIAYAASIGGIGTLIGTPPNAFMAAFLSSEYNIDISFVGWMMLAMPIVFIMLPATWFVLTHILYPECTQKSEKSGRSVIQDALKTLGAIQMAEKRVGIIFLLAASLWIFRPLLNEIAFLNQLNDTSIGIFCGLLLFLLPSGNPGAEKDQRLLSWQDAEKLPWGVLVLFGGGLSLAAAIGSTDVASWIGAGLSSMADIPLFLLIFVICTTILLLTELTSNVTTTAAFLPIVASIAVVSGIPPLLLAVPAALAASCAFMLPVATPPNAVVFASGYISVSQMIKAGIFINLIAIIIITLASRYLLPIVF